jgi:5'-nucleotidase
LGWHGVRAGIASSPVLVLGRESFALAACFMIDFWYRPRDFCMTILVTNDDGIEAEGLWSLVRELRSLAPVMVVAPEKEQSAIGTAVTLYRRLGIRRVETSLPMVEAYSVAGTPSDCVIVGLSMLDGQKVGMVVSGINHGANLGDDVLISGTVAGALQGYLKGLHAVAVSIERAERYFMDTAARLTGRLCRWIGDNSLAGSVFLNVNVPNLPVEQVRGVKLTRLARGTHTDVAEEESDGSMKYYWLVRQRNGGVVDGRTDIGVVEQGNISITPLHTDWLNRAAPAIPDNLSYDLSEGLGEPGTLKLS